MNTAEVVRQLKELLSGERVPPNTKNDVIVRVPAGLIAYAIKALEREESVRERTLKSNLWYD